MFWTVIPAQIEKEILIEAPIDVVWRAVTEPDHIVRWFSSEAQLEQRTGGAGRLSFPSGQTYYLHIEAFEPPHRFAYRWLQDSAAPVRPDNSTLVEITLRAEADQTRLRVVESGFDQVDWSDDAKTRYVDDHSGGWGRFVERLRVYAGGTARE